MPVKLKLLMNAANISRDPLGSSLSGQLRLLRGPGANRRPITIHSSHCFRKEPVRLYYSIPDLSFVIKKLKSLKCMIEVPPEQCWQWLFQAEAASFRFPGGYDDVPKEKRPIVLGRIRFSNNGTMTLAAIIKRLMKQGT